MTPTLILETLRNRGARLHLIDGGRIAVSPREALDDHLRVAIRREKPALVRLLVGPVDMALPPQLPIADYDAIYAELAADSGTDENLAAIARHVGLNGFWVAEEVTWLERRCDRLARAGADAPTYRAAVVLLAARMDEVRGWCAGTAAEPSHTHRLNVLVNQPKPARVDLSDGTQVANVGRFIGRLLTAVDYLLGHPKIASAEAMLGIYVEQLAMLGVVGRIERVQ